jgi:hypothetical protein
VIHVGHAEDLEALLAQHVKGSLIEPMPGERWTVSLERRRGSTSDSVLVFNESWSPQAARLRFTRAGRDLTQWQPRTGSRTRLREAVRAGDAVSVDLEPAGTLVLTIGSVE